MMLKILILRLMPRLLRAFFWSLTPGKQEVLTISVEDFWNCALPSFLLYSVSCSHGLKENAVPFTWKTSVICPVPENETLFKWLSSHCSDIYCNDLFWAYPPPPTCETHKAPFRPIPVWVQAQQKQQRCKTHSFAQCIYTHLEKPGSFISVSSSTFLLPSMPYNHT